ncbi:WD40 repeat domain-containing protein [Candidatus Babeliales bacterium]|nr:WD40 repeat domain-containing protein [Candidatus Babeliales bacterium]
MNYKKWLLNGLIVCGFSSCFAAQEAQQIGWENHEVPDDLESGQFYNSKTLHMGTMVWNIALSPDERLLGVNGPTNLSIVDMETGRNIYDRRAVMSALAWMHNTPFIVVLLGGDIEIINPLSGEMVQKLKGLNLFAGRSIAVSGDDTTLASGSDDNTVKIGDIRSGKCVQTLKGHGGRVNSVAISLNGRTVVSGWTDGIVKIWDIRSGKRTHILKGHGHWVESIAISWDGKTVVSGSRDKTVKIWDIRSSKKYIQTLKGHAAQVNSVVISFDGRTVVSGSDDNTVKVWDSISGECTQTLEGHQQGVRSVIVNSDNKTIVSGSFDKPVKVWEQKK